MTRNKLEMISDFKQYRNQFIDYDFSDEAYIHS